ncbi:MAG TPA: hypothetical protein PKI20_18775 [Verrucomicrobiota bacterium]|jgi:hypothetical protein|nr:hypothetical protein [Verrucomicrobiota bacterium]HQL79784.1 hypothetical protein [Verrucomicrobiota bacterium]
MKTRTAIRGGLALLLLIGLVCVLVISPPLPGARTQASRVTSVNSLRSVSFTLPNSTVLPAAQPGTSN